jgi:hypothetical protein
MSTFIVQSVDEISQWQSAQGGPMWAAKMSGLLDGQIVTNAQINAKTQQNLPQPGQTIDVTATPDRYGYKLKKNAPGMGGFAPQAPQGSVVQQAGQFAVPTAQPGSVAPQKPATPPRDEYAERQSSIERQNALTNSVAYCTAKATALLAAKKPEAALSELTGKHVLDVATFFARYNAGKVIASMTPEQVAEEFGYVAPKEPAGVMADPGVQNLMRTASQVFHGQADGSDEAPVPDDSNIPF